MTKTLTAVAFSTGLLLCASGVALAQSSATHGTTGSTMSTTPNTSQSMGTTGAAPGSTMSATNHPITSEGQLKQDLQVKGYSDVTDIKHEGNYYTANAKQNGHSVKLRVDASSGTVTNQPG